MKTLELESVKEKLIIEGKEVAVDMSTIGVLKNIITSPVEGGYTSDELITRTHLLEIVNNAKGDTLTLEDDEFLFLQNLIKNAKWSILSSFIVNIIKKFNNGI
jgi:hypothetical protein